MRTEDRGPWLVLLLVLLAVTIPTACVLWFTNETLNVQRDAARQRLIEAYRSQLALMRDRLETDWNQRRAELDSLAGRGGAAPAVFSRLVRAGVADAVICRNGDGSVAYPSHHLGIAPDPLQRRREWIEARALETRGDALSAATAYGRIAAAEEEAPSKARALQGQVRCLLRAGKKQAAIQVIQERLTKGLAARGSDLQGRIISADARLLALQLMPRSAPRYVDTARQLRDLLTDYSGPAMPSSQRMFLLAELRALRLGPEFDDARTYDAERLAADFLAADTVWPDRRVLSPSAVPGVFALASHSGRLIALYRSGTLLAAMGRLLTGQNVPAPAAFSVLPPGSRSQGGETIPAGPTLPGWRIGFSLNDGPSFQEVLRRQTIFYSWMAFLAIATLAVGGILVGRVASRQARLARLKTDLVATVSHELKTPLSSMQLLTDALLEDGRFEPWKTREYLDLIAGENRRLSRLIDNFLAFSRMERNRYKFEFAETNAADIVAAALGSAREKFTSMQSCVNVEISPGLPVLRADRDALVTVLMNLLDNAWKFTAEEKRQIILRAFRAGEKVTFEVSDNGIGIPPREQKRIFRGFYQVDRRLSRQAGGCGLGLSIVQFIVKAHGGDVRVRSRPGAGSTFVVSLPAITSRNGAPG